MVRYMCLSLVFSTDPERTMITFRELDEKSSVLAAWFLQVGMQPGDRLLALGPNCPEWLYLDVATMKAGLLLIKGAGEMNSKETIEKLLNNHRCKAFVINPGENEEITQKINTVLPGVLESKTAGYNDLGLKYLSHVISMTEDTKYNLLTVRQILRAPVSDTCMAKLETIMKNMKPSDPATTFSTSGSTGEPKIVVHTHQSLANSFASLVNHEGLQPFASRYFNDRIFTWIGSFVHLAYGNGITMVYIDTKYTLKMKCYDFVYRVLAEERITNALLLPYLLYDIITVAEKGKPNALSCLECAVTGGERADKATIERVMKFIPTLWVGYGCTEIMPIATYKVNQLQFAGKAIPNAQIKIVNENMEIVPIGTTGEIIVNGPMRFSHYLDQPETTQRALTPEGWFRTGDVGTMTEERGIVISGRSTEVISRATRKVYPSVIESSLAGLPGLGKCVAVGVPDPRLFEEICVFVILDKGSTLTGDEIRAHAERNMLGDPALGFVPKYISIVNEFPVGRTGKVDRKALRALAIKKYNLVNV